jgi:hypothetical protein
LLGTNILTVWYKRVVQWSNRRLRRNRGPEDRSSRSSPDTRETDKGPGLVVVRASVRSSRVDEFNDWYDREHLPYALAHLPGVNEARRYTLVVTDSTSRAEHQFLVTYSVDDVSNVEAAFDGPAMREGIRLYDERWGTDSVRTRAGYRETSRLKRGEVV